MGTEIGALRFAVGKWDGPHSSTWRVWATREGDVFVAQRAIAGDVKASFHRSGRWRFGLTGKHQAGVSRFLPAGQNRASLKWERPPDLVSGLTQAFTVLVPTSEIRPQRYGPAEQDERIVWIPPAPQGEAVEVHLFLTTEGVSDQPLVADTGRPSQKLWHLDLPDGERLLAMWHHERLSDALKALIEDHRRMMMDSVRRLTEETRRSLDPRGYVLISDTGIGTPFLIDVALPVPDDET